MDENIQQTNQENQSQPVVPQQVETVQSPTQTPPPKKRFPKKTLLLIIVLILVTAGLLIYALPPKQNKNIFSGPTPTLDPIQTTLNLSLPSLQASPSGSYKADILITTGENKVSKVQLELSYDPNALGKVDIEKGPFFQDGQVVIKNVDQKNGRITFILSSSSPENDAKGQGTVATISFTPLAKNTSTKLEFLPKTEIRAEGYSQSVLKEANARTFVFGSLTISPTPKTSTSSAK